MLSAPLKGWVISLRSETMPMSNRTNLPNQQPNNPLHGITLSAILEFLVAEYGWEQLGERVKINCFITNPSLNSSLKFLRRTPWAREKVEKLYLELQHKNS